MSSGSFLRALVGNEVPAEHLHSSGKPIPDKGAYRVLDEMRGLLNLELGVEE